MATSIPSSMRAWQFASASPTVEANLKLNNSAPLPDGAGSLKDDQILVRVLITSLNPVDFKFAEVPIVGRLIYGSPATPSMDFVGRVVSLGANSKKAAPVDLKEGQLVYGRLDGPSKFGALADYTIARRSGCVPLPSDVSKDDAACVTSTGLTAYQTIVPKIKGHSGERVFINGGSGGVGTFAIQIAKNIGCHVTTSCSTPNVELCKSLGADVVIDYKTQDVLAELKKSQKFDLIVDNVGFPSDLYWECPKFTTSIAPYVQVGAPAVSFGFVFGNMYKQLWPGFLGGGKRPWEFLALTNKPEHYAAMTKWMQEGKLKGVVDEIFDFEDKGPVKAYAKLRLGRTRGKILVKVAEDSQ